MLSFVPNHELFKVRLVSDILWILLYFQWLFNVKVNTPFLQDKSGAMKVQALITVCVGEWLSMLNIQFHVSMILQPIFFLSFPIVKLSDFGFLNYLATTYFNLATVFSLQVTWNIFQFQALHTIQAKR